MSNVVIEHNGEIVRRRVIASPGEDGPSVRYLVPPSMGQLWPRASSEVLRTKRTATLTTASLSYNAQELATVTMAEAYELYRVQTSRPARVRIYTTAEKQYDDRLRAQQVIPPADSGLVLEAITYAGNLILDVAPAVDGTSLDFTSVIPVTVENLDSAVGSVIVNILYVRTA